MRAPCLIIIVLILGSCCARISDERSEAVLEFTTVEGVSVVSPTIIVVRDEGKLRVISLAAVEARQDVSEAEMLAGRRSMTRWVVGRNLRVAYVNAVAWHEDKSPSLAYVGAGKLLLNAEVIRLSLAQLDAGTSSVPSDFVEELQSAASGLESVTTGDESVPWDRPAAD